MCASVSTACSSAVAGGDTVHSVEELENQADVMLLYLKRQIGMCTIEINVQHKFLSRTLLFSERICVRENGWGMLQYAALPMAASRVGSQLCLLLC